MRTQQRAMIMAGVAVAMAGAIATVLYLLGSPLSWLLDPANPLKANLEEYAPAVISLGRAALLLAALIAAVQLLKRANYKRTVQARLSTLIR